MTYSRDGQFDLNFGKLSAASEPVIRKAKSAVKLQKGFNKTNTQTDHKEICNTKIGSAAKFFLNKKMENLTAIFLDRANAGTARSFVAQHMEKSNLLAVSTQEGVGKFHKKKGIPFVSKDINDLAGCGENP